MYTFNYRCKDVTENSVGRVNEFWQFFFNQQLLAADQGRCKEIAKVKTDPKVYCLNKNLNI